MPRMRKALFALVGAALLALASPPASAADPGTCLAEGTSSADASAREANAATQDAMALPGQAGADPVDPWGTSFRAATATGAYLNGLGPGVEAAAPDPQQCAIASGGPCVAAIDGYLAHWQGPADRARDLGVGSVEGSFAILNGTLTRSLSPEGSAELAGFLGGALGGANDASGFALVGAGATYVAPLPEVIAAGAAVGTQGADVMMEGAVRSLQGVAPMSDWLIVRLQGSYPPVVDAGEQFDDGDFSYLFLFPIDYANGQLAGPAPPEGVLAALLAPGEIPDATSGPQGKLRAYADGATAFPGQAASRVPGVGAPGSGGGPDFSGGVALVETGRTASVELAGIYLAAALASPGPAAAMLVALPTCVR